MERLPAVCCKTVSQPGREGVGEEGKIRLASPPPALPLAFPRVGSAHHPLLALEGSPISIFVVWL